MSRENLSLQIKLIAYIFKQVLPESIDKAYEKKFAMIQPASDSVAGLDDGRDTPNTYRDLLMHKNHAGWWESMN
jgi:hypothetical protein